MVGQASQQYTPRPQTLYVYLPDVDTTYKRAMSAGARSLQEVTDQFYGDRTGGFEDPAKNWWYVATHTEDISMEEMQRRLQNLQA
jgi:PhnB protein